MKNFFKKHFNLYDGNTGRNREAEGNVTKQINDTDFLTPNGSIATGDVKMLSFAFENMMDETITFLKMHEYRHYDGPGKIDCHSGEVVLVPHSYYLICSMSGKPITGKVHHGKDMHKALRK